MENKQIVKKYFNKYFKQQFYTENDYEFKALVRILNKKEKGNNNYLQDEEIHDLKAIISTLEDKLLRMESRSKKDFTKDINSHFLFVKYMNQFYDFNDNTGEGDIYLDMITKKKVTETEIYNKWLKVKSKYHGNDLLHVVNGSDSKEQIITQLLDKLHVEAKEKKIKEYNNMIACSYGIVTIDIKIK